MQSKAQSVEQYLAELPEDRRAAIQAVREVILKNLPKGYEEGMQYGMIGYYVPHSVYPDGYHCDPSQPLPFAALASQKRHMAVYLMCVYSHPEHDAWFREAWAKTGKKLDMGKSCVRFRTVDDVPLKVIGQAIRRVPAKRFIEYYEATTKDRAGKRSKKVTTQGTATKKTPAKSARKVAVRKKTSASQTVSSRTSLAKKTTRKQSTAKKMAASKRHTVAKPTVKKKATARHKNRHKTSR
jgi:hypothetical protein